MLGGINSHFDSVEEKISEHKTQDKNSDMKQGEKHDLTNRG